MHCIMCIASEMCLCAEGNVLSVITMLQLTRVFLLHAYPANTIHRPNQGSMLHHCL